MNRRFNPMMGSSLSPSAPVPTFQPANSDVSMEANRRDRTQEQYKPNANYRPPAIGPSNPMTPTGSMPGASNPMGNGTPGMDSNKGVPYSGMGSVPYPQANPYSGGGGVPYSGNSGVPTGLGPSFMDFKNHMNSNLPTQRNDIQTNANRVSQGLNSYRDMSKNNISFMGQPISFGGDQRMQINRKGQY